VADGAVLLGVVVLGVVLVLEPPEAALASAAPPPIRPAVAKTTAAPFAMPRCIPYLLSGRFGVAADLGTEL
jgi:hypothetical protein